MAKLFSMFMILIALQAAMLLYVGNSEQQNDIWTFITSLDNWGSATFLVSIGAIASAITISGITSGTFFGFKTDFLLLAAMIGGLISIGAVFTQFGNLLRHELISRIFTDCSSTAANSCASANYLVAIMIGPIAFYYAWTVIEYWRGKDM